MITPTCARTLVALAATAALGMSSTRSLAQCVIEMPRPGLPTTVDYYGVSGALDGEYALVGAYADDTVRDGAGAVHVFSADTGAFIRTLYPPNVGTTHFFGKSIASEDGIALIGASAAHPTAAAYLIDLASGSTLHTFSPPEDYSGVIQFGTSVCVDGDRLYISAKERLSTPGAVFVYDRVTYELLHVLEAPSEDPADEFGDHVEISAGRVAVSAHRASDEGFQSGSVYLFDRETGAYLATIVGDDSDNQDRFGSAIALDGDTLVVASPEYDAPFLTTNGAVFVYDLAVGVPSIDVYYTQDGALPAGGFEFLHSLLFYPQDGVTARRMPSGELAGNIAHPGVGVAGFGTFVAESEGQLLIGSNGSGVSPGPARVHLYPNGFTALPGDVTGNGCVDSEDLAALLAAWGTSSSDLDGDGVVGSSDLAVLLAAWSN